MPKGRGNGKGAPGKRTGTPRPMNKPAMMDWALRLLRLLNERKVLNSRIVAEEFDVNIRTAQRYLLYLSDLPCVVVDYRGFRDVRLGSMVQDFPDLNFRRFQLR